MDMVTVVHGTVIVVHLHHTTRGAGAMIVQGHVVTHRVSINQKKKTKALDFRIK